jgi:hypothetical protein
VLVLVQDLYVKCSPRATVIQVRGSDGSAPEGLLLSTHIDVFDIMQNGLPYQLSKGFMGVISERHAYSALTATSADITCILRL